MITKDCFLPVLNKGMTFVIFISPGKICVVKDLLNMFVKGILIKLITFLSIPC